MRMKHGDARVTLSKAYNALPFRTLVVNDIGGVPESPLEDPHPYCNGLPDEIEQEYDHAAVTCSSDPCHILQHKFQIPMLPGIQLTNMTPNRHGRPPTQRDPG